MSTLPPGYSPADNAITADDRGGWLVIASSIALVFILMFAYIRLWMRYPFPVALSLDDSALFASTVFAVIQAILTIVAVRIGFGKSELILDSTSVDRTAKIVYAGEYFYLLALFTSKISMLFLEKRLSPEPINAYLTTGSLAVTAVVLCAAIFMIAFGCDTVHPWLQITDECNSLYVRWVVIGACGVLIEVFIFAIISRIFFTLQRDLKGKLKGPAVFALRLPVIIFSVCRILALSDFRGSADPTIDRLPIGLWTAAELAWSLSTATLPCIVPFMMNLNTTLGALTPETVIRQTQQDSQKFVGGSYELRSTKRSLVRSVNEDQMRLDDVIHQCTIASPNMEERSVASDDSTGLIIKKRVEISFSAATR